mmetsp:Transcript_38432/g.63665  ORF Transcript_38432/g.63665 Transcript_38432/m.63665 type:complete len:418 (+) Transcript_38432:75-1328(+)
MLRWVSPDGQLYDPLDPALLPAFCRELALHPSNTNTYVRRAPSKGYHQEVSGGWRLFERIGWLRFQGKYVPFTGKGIDKFIQNVASQHGTSQSGQPLNQKRFKNLLNGGVDDCDGWRRASAPPPDAASATYFKLMPLPDLKPKASRQSAQFSGLPPLPPTAPVSMPLPQLSGLSPALPAVSVPASEVLLANSARSGNGNGLFYDLASLPQGVVGTPASLSIPFLQTRAEASAINTAAPPATYAAAPRATDAVTHPTAYTAVPPATYTAVPPTTNAAVPPATNAVVPPATNAAIPPATNATIHPATYAAIPATTYLAAPPATNAAIPPTTYAAVPPTNTTNAAVPPTTHTTNGTALPNMSRFVVPPGCEGFNFQLSSSSSLPFSTVFQSTSTPVTGVAAVDLEEQLAQAMQAVADAKL